MGNRQPERSATWLRHIAPNKIGVMALAVAALTVGLVAYGSWVRVSASGLGCPDWPLCDDSFIPKGTAALIESGHRWYAGAVMLMLALTTFLALISKAAHRSTARVLVAASAVILIQAALGGVVVFTELHPLTRLAHLALAMIIIGLLTIAGIGFISGRPRPTTRTGWHLLLVSAGAIMVGGSIVATQTTFDCSSLPICHSGPSMASWLHGIHRILGVSMLLATSALALKLWIQGDRTPYFRTALCVSLLILAQIGIGSTAIVLDVPNELRIAHVGLGAMIWWGMVGMWALNPGTLPNHRG